MSLRLARLFTATLIGLSASATLFAADTALVWRGDITTARGVVIDVAKAWEKSGKGKFELQPFNTASGIDGYRRLRASCRRRGRAVADLHAGGMGRPGDGHLPVQPGEQHHAQAAP
jgi:hypothetical protein